MEFARDSSGAIRARTFDSDNTNHRPATLSHLPACGHRVRARDGAASPEDEYTIVPTPRHLPLVRTVSSSLVDCIPESTVTDFRRDQGALGWPHDPAAGRSTRRGTCRRGDNLVTGDTLRSNKPFPSPPGGENPARREANPRPVRAAGVWRHAQGRVDTAGHGQEERILGSVAEGKRAPKIDDTPQTDAVLGLRAARSMARAGSRQRRSVPRNPSAVRARDRSRPAATARRYYSRGNHAAAVSHPVAASVFLSRRAHRPGRRG